MNSHYQRRAHFNSTLQWNLVYPAVQPPSMSRLVPVIIAAASLARKTTAPIMSSVLLQAFVSADFRYDRLRTGRGGYRNGWGKLLQGPALHRGGDPLGGAVVSDVPHELPRSRTMLLDRGVEVDHTTIFRWIQAYAAELEKRIRPYLRMSNGSWRVDETYVRVKGRWTYLYRAVDSRGQTIDFLLSAQRDTARRSGSFARRSRSRIR